MKGYEIFKKGKHTSNKFWIVYVVCIIVLGFSALSMSNRIDSEKPNATDFTENGALGTEKGKYVYLQVDGLTDVVATYGYENNQEDGEKYYIALSGNYWYVVCLDNTTYEELKNIQSYSKGKIENKPASVTIYGVTKEIPDDLKQIIMELYNSEFDEDDEKITIDNFEKYFGSVLLDTSETPVDLTVETVLALIAVITLFVALILQFVNKLTRIKVMKYLKENGYEEELQRQLDDNIEKTFFYEKVIITKDYIVDTTNGAFVAVKFSDIKWIYTHRLKYYGVVSISNNIILRLNDCKTQFQILDTKGKLSDEFEKVFEEICNKLSNDVLKGYTNENIKEFNQYKKEIKG